MSDPLEDKELADLLSSLTPTKKPVELDTADPKKKRPPLKKAPVAPKPVVEAPATPVQEPTPTPELEDDGEELPEPPVVDKPDIIEPVLVPAQPIVVEPPPPANLQEQPKPTADQIGFRLLVTRFQSTADLIIDNQASDRTQIESIIQLYEQQVRGAGSSTQGMTPYIEGLVKLLEIKANINANATGVLDSISKFVASGKGNDLIINLAGDTVQKRGTIDLEKLLGQPPKADEKK